MDIKDAYRIIPIHPQDHHPLGIQWHGNVGMRSAPKVFTAFADMVAWRTPPGRSALSATLLRQLPTVGTPGTN